MLPSRRTFLLVTYPVRHSVLNPIRRSPNPTISTVVVRASVRSLRLPIPASTSLLRMGSSSCTRHAMNSSRAACGGLHRVWYPSRYKAPHPPPQQQGPPQSPPYVLTRLSVVGEPILYLGGDKAVSFPCPGMPFVIARGGNLTLFVFLA